MRAHPRRKSREAKRPPNLHGASKGQIGTRGGLSPLVPELPEVTAGTVASDDGQTLPRKHFPKNRGQMVSAAISRGIIHYDKFGANRINLRQNGFDSLFCPGPLIADRKND